MWGWFSVLGKKACGITLADLFGPNFNEWKGKLPRLFQSEKESVRGWVRRELIRHPNKSMAFQVWHHVGDQASRYFLQTGTDSGDGTVVREALFMDVDDLLNWNLSSCPDSQRLRRFCTLLREVAAKFCLLYNVDVFISPGVLWDPATEDWESWLNLVFESLGIEPDSSCQLSFLDEYGILHLWPCNEL